MHIPALNHEDQQTLFCFIYFLFVCTSFEFYICSEKTGSLALLMTPINKTKMRHLLASPMRA